MLTTTPGAKQGTRARDAEHSPPPLRFSDPPPISLTMAVRWLLASCALFGAATCCRPEAAGGEEAAPAQSPAATQSLHYRLKVSLGFHYSNGDYGTSDTTEIFYVPLFVRAEVSRFTLQATIPYIRVDGPAGIIDGPAGPIETSGKGDGLGDIFVRGSYFLPRKPAWPSWVPFVDLAGLVKFPTASRSDGLGTGEFDFGIESDLIWLFGRLSPFATIGYRFLGDPPDADLNDVFGATVGAQYHVLDTVWAGLLLDYRQPSSSVTDERLELVPFGSWAFAPLWSFEPYVSVGLADGSPDAGVGVQLGRSW